MKKTVLCFVSICIVSLIAALPVQAQTGGAACDPKKIEDCCAKMDSLLSSIDTLRAKVVKMQAELKKGNTKITPAQLDKTVEKVEQIESVISRDSHIWDY